MNDETLDTTCSCSSPAARIELAIKQHAHEARALTPPAVAKRYGVNVHRVLGWIAKGELAAVNVGDGTRPRWRIMPDALMDFERRRAATPPPPPRRAKNRETYTRYF
jgi:hypothetical protein